MYSTLFRRLLALPLLFVIACKHDNLLIPKPNENSRPAADFIRNNYDFRLFYAAIEYTGLTDELNGAGPFTILAIPDQGFKALGILNEAQVRTLNKDSLQQVLRFHVLKDRRLVVGDIPTNAVDVQFETLSGDRVYTSAMTKDNAYFFNGARITRSDIILSNGVLHVMNKPLQHYKGRTVQDYLSTLPQYSTYVAGLKKFGLWDELSGKGPFTIFAPTNELYEVQGITPQTIAGMNVDAYDGKRLFGSYILYGKHFFVSDQYIFKQMGAGYVYDGKLRNDTWYVRLGSNELRTSAGDNFFTPYPELSLWKPGIRSGMPDDRIGMVSQTYNQPKPLVWYDHQCENGIVHQLHGLLALPADVIK